MATKQQKEQVEGWVRYYAAKMNKAAKGDSMPAWHMANGEWCAASLVAKQTIGADRVAKIEAEEAKKVWGF